MAVSKTQNERPAIGALIDAVNMAEPIVAQNVQNIATLTEGLADEVSDREAADTSLQNQLGNGFAQTSVTTSLSATNQQVLLLGNEQDELSEIVSDILATLANIKVGATEEITVPANDSYSSSYVYPEPFDASSKSFVLLGFADDLLQATLEVTLIDSTYSGFSYSITNSDADPATVTIGYLAIAIG